jgi:uncharacterized protein
MAPSGDEAKSRASLERRGFDFEYAARIFEGAVLEREDQRRLLWRAGDRECGLIDGDGFVVVYTWRGNRRSIISARRAGRSERDAYRKAFGSGDS